MKNEPSSIAASIRGAAIADGSFATRPAFLEVMLDPVTVVASCTS